MSETTRLIVEYFLVEEFLNKRCVICMMWIMPGPANTLRTKTTANTKHPPVLSMFCEEKDKTRQDMVKTVGIDTRAVHSAAPGGVTWGSPELRAHVTTVHSGDHPSFMTEFKIIKFVEATL